MNNNPNNLHNPFLSQQNPNNNLLNNYTNNNTSSGSHYPHHNRPRSIDVTDNDVSPEYNQQSGSKTHKSRRARFPFNLCHSLQQIFTGQCMILLVCLSLILNVTMFTFVLLKQYGTNNSDNVNSADNINGMQLSHVSILESPEYVQLLDQHTKAVTELNELQSESKKQLNEWMIKYKQLQLSKNCEEKVCPPEKECPLPPPCPTCSICATCPVCPICPQQQSIIDNSNCACRLNNRMLPDDLSQPTSKFDPIAHEIAWEYCSVLDPNNKTLEFCPETAINEQYYQLTFFNRPGAGAKVAMRKNKPQFPTCVQLPPLGYVWPAKKTELPVKPGEYAVNWPNLRVKTIKDLVIFNEKNPKNLFHFNASFYDVQQENILNNVAKYIPFGPKVRLVLDVGAGGASLGLHLKQRYDVQTISTVFADWPYCEYITERGGLCMYIDAMEPMPFAKFSYDVIHSSWIFHALFNNQLREAFLEQNRILRPGGYMWINGGWSYSQVQTMEQLFLNELGYIKLYESKKPVVSNTKFDTVHYELDWEVVLLKPIKAQCKGQDREKIAN